MIQYWQLYAFNDSTGSINHEADWEYTAIVIDAREAVRKVLFFRHGHVREVEPSMVEWEGTHHVTYSAKGGHGQYRGASLSNDCHKDDFRDTWQGVADACDPRGVEWRSWEPGFGGIVNVGELANPLNDSGWLRYSGLWGEVGNAADLVSFTSGPRGPAYQPDNWTWGGPIFAPLDLITPSDVAPADYDGDGETDVAFKSDSGVWYVDLAHNGFGGWDMQRSGHGNSSCIAVPADYDGDGRADLSVKCGDGTWYIDHAATPHDGWNSIRSGYGAWDARVLW